MDTLSVGGSGTLVHERNVIYKGGTEGVPPYGQGENIQPVHKYFYLRMDIRRSETFTRDREIYLRTSNWVDLPISAP